MLNAKEEAIDTAPRDKHEKYCKHLLFANFFISEKSNTNGARNTSPIEAAAAPKAETKRKDFGDPMLDDFKDHYNVIFIGHVGRLIFYPCM